jgi:hypothetical protein
LTHQPNTKYLSLMKKLLIRHTLSTLLLAILSVVNVNAQQTCYNALYVPYIFSGAIAVPAFSTFGIPNDNVSSGATLCGTTVGTGGQHWYTIALPNIVPTSCTISTDLPVTNFDTKIHIYTGTCGALTCVAGDDDSGTGNTSVVTFTAQPYTVYIIRIGGFNSLEGMTSFTIDAGVLGCTDLSASNYNSSAVIDNGTCCYAGSISLSMNVPIGNYARVFANNIPVATVYSGETATFCSEKSCGNYIEFHEEYGFGWGSGTYTITMDGITLTSSPPPVYLGSAYVDIETEFCGCTDPLAQNYSNTAEQDAGNCYYSTNTNCSDALSLNPNTVVWATTTNIPVFSGNTGDCYYALYGQKLIWYKFVYPGGSVKIDTPVSSNDTVLGIYEDCGGTALACVDDVYIPIENSPSAYWPTNAHIRIDCEDGYIKGHTYFVAVGIYAGEGTFPLSYEVYETKGCTDPLATNYNACASIDDGTCIADTCPADLDNSGYVNISDLLQFVSAYGSDCSNL